MFFNSDRMSFQILSVTHFCHQNGYFSVSPRPYAALSFRLKGQGDFRLGSAAFRSVPGDIGFFPADVGYEVEYTDSESLVIHLTDCTYHEAENVRLHHPDYILRLIHQLKEQWETGCLINQTKGDIYHLLAKVEEDMRSGANDALQTCTHYLETHFTAHELTIPEVCRQGNISEAGLYRQFMAYYGMSPKQYLVKLRLGYAMELLLQGQLPVQEIAKRTGFQDPKYFARCFKLHFGTPPSKFLESNVQP